MSYVNLPLYIVYEGSFSKRSLFWLNFFNLEREFWIFLDENVILLTITYLLNRFYMCELRPSRVGLSPTVSGLGRMAIVPLTVTLCACAHFGWSLLQAVCGWVAQTLARLSVGHRVQTMTNPNPTRLTRWGFQIA